MVASSPMKGHKDGARYRSLVYLPSDPKDCWLWKGSINPKTGYGKKQWFGETWLAHRWVWTMLFGSIPKNLTIDHLCRNRACVNPHHLETVPQEENIRRGNGTKLNADQVREIRSLDIKWGERDLVAKKYGVSPMTISDIRCGRSWFGLKP